MERGAIQLPRVEVTLRDLHPRMGAVLNRFSHEREGFAGNSRAREGTRGPVREGGTRRGEIWIAELSPAVSGRENVLPHYVAPGNEGKKNHDHKNGVDVFSGRGRELMSGPERVSKGE